jgi:hypothetical protein
MLNPDCISRYFCYSIGLVDSRNLSESMRNNAELNLVVTTVSSTFVFSEEDFQQAFPVSIGVGLVFMEFHHHCFQF